ncbi:translation initiation factor eIF-2B subunit alpha [Tulasnella sp. JGI-2019a]|nr:translation initiation factor eIF-2B subunit alpha [Tulasnella sp. JGI-2019a]
MSGTPPRGALTPKSPRSPVTALTSTSKGLGSAIKINTILEDQPSDFGLRPGTPADVYAIYQKFLANHSIPMPIAAILTLTEVIASSGAGTMFEVVEAMKNAATVLKAKSPNPISLTAGCDLFIRFVTMSRQDYKDFSAHKADLVRQGKEYAATATSCREKIAEHAFGFIKEDAIILTHSYSRVVMQALLRANKRKRISVYVTEARPRGLGMKTYDELTAAGIPCTVVLDSAVAYCMDEVDLVLVGSEAVVESGGLINAVGTLSMAIIAKAANKPFYALAESYKFLRLFPLSQYDLPTHNPGMLALPSQKPTLLRPRFDSRNNTTIMPTTPRPHAVTTRSSMFFSSTQESSTMSAEQLDKNPEVDYTRPDLITLVFSDVGILTPDGISSFLVGVFAD